MRAEKKEKKHFEKQKKAMGLGGGTSMVKPKEPPKPVRDALLLLYSKQSSFVGNAIGRTKRYKSAVSRGQRIG